MRRAAWLLVAIAVPAALWVWGPSWLVQQQTAAVVRSRLGAAGPVAVRARATALGLVRGRVDWLEIEAGALPLGELSAQRMRARLVGVLLERAGGGRAAIREVASGSAEFEIGQADLERFLSNRGVAGPSVTIGPDGVAAAGRVRVGTVEATAHVRGQFYAISGTELHFRVSSLVVSGVEVPMGFPNTFMALAASPVVSLKTLPVPARIERVEMGNGRLVIFAQVGGRVP